ncbi:MAG: Gfo/Idh/MocA family oxidoreductase [Solirubrobacterales bacterium]|nr:Gfo/Idh/MocA family oxidoreductase [Solirubrobacterales bacterium]
MADRIRVGIVGCGLIAQVMHLPYLAELSDRFHVSAVCDLSARVASGCAERYGVDRVHTRWQDLLGEDLDAVMVLTSGDHAPIAIEAARHMLHVFVEKPMALSSSDGSRMVEAAEAAGVRLMVGTMKRYDPAYQRLCTLLADTSDVRLIRVTTLESPLTPYVAHYPLITAESPAPELFAGLQEAESEAVDNALPDADEQTRWCYRWILLDNLVHEFNALRGALGEPTEIRSADLSRRCVGVNLRFGETDCHLSWVELPGIARYKQEFAFYAADRRITLELPSPFLRSMPSRLVVEGGEPGTAHSWKRDEIVSFDEAFKRELVEFSDCILTGHEPRTSGHDGLADLLLLEAVARAHLSANGGQLTQREAPAGGVREQS